MSSSNRCPVVILCGGRGTRLQEETEYRPKPLVHIGGLPILWHIMKLYSVRGYKEFILCLGHKGNQIKEFFMHYDWDAFDFTLDLGTKEITYHEKDREDWRITFVDTGLETMTAGRVKKVEKYIDKDQFMLTYGDGVTNIDVEDLMSFHTKQNRIGTITGVRPSSKYGAIRVEGSAVTEFKEKPVLDDYINGGFMVFKNEVFDEIKEDCMLVEKTLPNLAKNNQLSIYKHDGFWHCMDTYKDYLCLNEIWSSGKIPWRLWK